MTILNERGPTKLEASSMAASDRSHDDITPPDSYNCQAATDQYQLEHANGQQELVDYHDAMRTIMLRVEAALYERGELLIAMQATTDCIKELEEYITIAESGIDSLHDEKELLDRRRDQIFNRQVVISSMDMPQAESSLKIAQADHKASSYTFSELDISACSQQQGISEHDIPDFVFRIAAEQQMINSLRDELLKLYEEANKLEARAAELPRTHSDLRNTLSELYAAKNSIVDLNHEIMRSFDESKQRAHVLDLPPLQTSEREYGKMIRRIVEGN